MLMLNVKKIRLDMGITQSHASSEIGISDRAYRDIENGKSTPSFNTMKKMEKFFHKTYQELLLEV